jgi:hypothetical protein
MVELGTALRELASEVEASPEVDGSDLWSRGRARVRRRRVVGAGVVSALVVVVTLAGLLVPAPVVVMPAGAPHGPAVPENVYVPSRWLAGTADEGPLGQLAVLGSAARGDGAGVYGVSATTGEYRFLDLPGQVRGTDVAMSPDGRRIAYWITGPTSGTAYPSELYEGVVGGLALYDTVDGSVRRAFLRTDHGLEPFAPIWLGAHTVAVEEWRRTSKTAARRAATYLWNVEDASPRLDGDSGALSLLQPNRDGSFLRSRGNGLRFDTVTVADARVSVVPGQTMVLPAQATPQTAIDETVYTQVSRSGDLVAVVPNGTAAYSNPLMVGTVGADGQVAALAFVARVQSVQLLGWRDDHTVLVTGKPRGGDYGMLSADLRARTVQRVGSVEGALLSTATDLLSAPMVPGLRPPDPIDPRWRTAGIAAAFAALGGVALVLVRRRRLRA